MVQQGGYMNKQLLSIVICILVAMFFINCGSSDHYGKISGIVGDAFIYKHTGKDWSVPKAHMKLESGDSLKTDKDSYIEIHFGNRNRIRLGENTKICFTDTVGLHRHRNITIFNQCGEVLSDVPHLRKSVCYEVRTPTSAVTVKGTHFLVEFDPIPHITHVNVFKGAVNVWNPFLPPMAIVAPIVVLPGFFTTIELNHPPIFPVKMNYGQFKKHERLFGPREFRYYNKHLGIAPVPFAPFPAGPDKHFAKEIMKEENKMFKHGNEPPGPPGILPPPGPPPLLAPFPPPPGTGNIQKVVKDGGKGKKGKNNKK
jgi:hypothetical protein